MSRKMRKDVRYFRKNIIPHSIVMLDLFKRCMILPLAQTALLLVSSFDAQGTLEIVFKPVEPADVRGVQRLPVHEGAQ